MTSGFPKLWLKMGRVIFLSRQVFSSRHAIDFVIINPRVLYHDYVQNISILWQCRVYFIKFGSAEKFWDTLACQSTAVSFSNYDIERHSFPIILLFFHIVPYLHRKCQANYLTRGVTKTFQIAAAENVWVSVNHYHMTTHVLKVERSSMSVIQRRWRTLPPRSPFLSFFFSPLVDLRPLWDGRNAGETREAPWNDD